MKKQVFSLIISLMAILAFSCDQQRQISKTKKEPTEQSQGGGDEAGGSQAGAEEGAMPGNEAAPDSLIDSAKAVDRGLPVTEEDYDDLKKKADKADKKSTNPKKKKDGSG